MIKKQSGLIAAQKIQYLEEISAKLNFIRQMMIGL